MSDLVAVALGTGLDRMVRGGLRGVWVRGELPAGPLVWAANHHSWWDPFVAAAVLRRLNRPACLLMSQENLRRYEFARRLGVFGSGEPRTGLRYLRQGRALVVYPEGELRPAGPPGPLAEGACWYSARAKVPLSAVAVRLAVRGHQAAEAYVSLTRVEPASTRSITTARLAEALRAGLSTLDRELAQADPREPLADFVPMVVGRRSWDERIDALARWRPWGG
jgi:1-acyl-sn-glycerol-3-phosphate acyltransferase